MIQNPVQELQRGDLVEVYATSPDDQRSDGKRGQPYWRGGYRIAEFADAGIWVERNVPLPGVQAMFLKPDQYRRITMQKPQPWDPP